MKLLLTLAMLGCYLQVVSQGCETLLQWGVYNTITQTSSSAQYRKDLANFCSTFQSDKYEQKTIDAAVKVFGIASGSTSYNNQEIDRLYSLNCSNSMSIQTLTQDLSFYQQYVDATIVQSFVACKALEAANVKIDIQAGADANGLVDYNIVTVSFVDNSATSSTKATIKAVKPNGRSIMIDNREVQVGVSFLSSAYKLENGSKSFSITRIAEKASDPLLYKGVQIAFELDVKTFTLNLPPIKRASYTLPGVGDVIASLLDESNFKALHDIKGKVEWVLADGRSVGLNSDFKRYTGNDKVPDLRDRFLRGASAPGLRTGVEQTDATRNPGFTISSDGGHSHDFGPSREGIFWSAVGIQNTPVWFKFFPDNGRVDATLQTVSLSGPAQLGKVGSTGYFGPHNHVLVGGDQETRPMNTSVNYFVCINSHN